VVTVPRDVGEGAYYEYVHQRRKWFDTDADLPVHTDSSLNLNDNAFAIVIHASRLSH
jgi:hypothetical protein